MSESFVIPYCGTAPVPAELWSRWNFDPALLLTLLARLAVLLGAACRPARLWTHAIAWHPSPHGWAALALGLVTPICGSSVALFSARVAQHLASAPAWGLRPLDDQQLGGLIIWVPGCLALTGIVLVLVLQMVRTRSSAAPLTGSAR